MKIEKSEVLVLVEQPVDVDVEKRKELVMCECYSMMVQEVVVAVVVAKSIEVGEFHSLYHWN